MRKTLIRLIALLLCLSMMASCAAIAESPALLAEPDLPDMAPYPGSTDGMRFNQDEQEAWYASLSAQHRDPSYMEGLVPFLTSSAKQILSGSGDANRVYSPPSLYMALAMLARSTGGQTRAQVLSLLGKEDVAALSQQASALWNANYRSDGAMTRTIATSLWLRDDTAYRADTVQTLADSYYASVYRGRMGTGEYNALLRQWLNDNTLGLLTDQFQNVFMPPDTMASIASAVALSAKWDKGFNSKATAPAVFHAPSGDVMVDFMHATREDDFYWGDRFTAVHCTFDLDGGMWLILPDEGYTPDDLLADQQALSFMLDPAAERSSRFVKINLSVPRFDVTSDLELSAALRALGVTDVFSEQAADFTPLTDTDQPVWLSQVQHAARVAIDEEGCKAAAYTVLLMVGAAPPQEREVVDFVLDRPFLFVITGADGLPLFVGVVNQP